MHLKKTIMAREFSSSGRGKGRGKDSKPEKRGSKSKSGWVKPDGTPMRARKGDYFPDKEIDQRKRKPSSGRNFTSRPRPTEDDSRERDVNDSPRESSERNSEERTFNKRDSKSFSKDSRAGRSDSRRDDDRPSRSGSDRKPYARRGDDERPSRDNDDRKPYARRGDDERPSRDNDDRKPYARRGDDERPSRDNDDRKPYARRGDDERPSRDTDDRKPYARRDDDQRPSRDNDDRKPYARRDDDKRPSRDNDDRKPYARRDDDKRPSRDTDDRKPYARRDDNNRSSSDRTPGKSFGKKPFEKKRERYADRDHSKEMGGRFDKRKDEKKFKTRNDRTPFRDKVASEPSEPGEVRLNRFIANAGICSRREADELITAGVISINGEIVTELGTKVKPGDNVKYHDQSLKTEKLVYVLLNKPKDYITTTDDPEERRTVMALVHDAGKERIVPVGRLDRNTTGLLLLTNDGELTKRLTHPSGNIKKLYQVELDKNLTQVDMVKAAEGIELEDGVVAFDEIQYASPDDKSIVGVELHSGKNRIVRRIFEAMGYEVRKLDRTTFAGLTKKDLPRGRWRYLTEMELNMLKMLTGKKK